MRVNIDEFRDYTNKAPCYVNGIAFVQSGIEKEDVNCLLMWLRRLCDDYKGLSFELVTSTHKSKGTIKKVVVRTGKAGRPKTFIQGEETEGHFHGVIINENEDNDIKEIKKHFQHYCKKRREKRSNLKRQKTIDVWKNNLSIVEYMERQADSRHRYGSFDFKYFNCIYYMPEDPRTRDYFNILELEE